MAERIYTCSYCGEEWPERDMDLIEEACGLCLRSPTHELDRKHREINRLAIEGMGLAVNWFEAATEDPYSKATWLLAQRFGLTTSIYKAAREELAREEERVGPPWSLDE